MAYFPYFRGKQYELICLRENSQLIAESAITTVIEPVKEAAVGIVRAIDSLKKEGAKFLIVANPSVGHHSDSLAPEFIEELNAAMRDYQQGGWVVQVEDHEDLDVLAQWAAHHPIAALLHHGGVAAKDVVQILQDRNVQPAVHIFGAGCSTRYRGAFPNVSKVMLGDGFKKRKNAEYPELELFSELPVTYVDYGASGFGDYLIVGSDYSEGGGAAYAVAIHITYSDSDDDGVIYVRHFISDTNNTPADPAGKFREALNKLVAYCESADSKIPNTKAIEEFKRLHSFGHFPGLGYVKKLSMQHHLEIMGQ